MTGWMVVVETEFGPIGGKDIHIYMQMPRLPKFPPSVLNQGYQPDLAS